MYTIVIKGTQGDIYLLGSPDTLTGPEGAWSLLERTTAGLPDGYTAEVRSLIPSRSGENLIEMLNYQGA